MKRLIFPLVLLVFLLLPCSAQAEQADDYYSRQYKSSGADSLRGALDTRTQRTLDELGLLPDTMDWTNALTPKGIFGMIWDFLSNGCKTPLAVCASVLGIALLCAAFSGLHQKTAAADVARYVAALLIGAAVLLPLFSTIKSAVSVMKGSATFMLSFIPVWCGILVTSGKPATGAGLTTLLLGASQAIVWLSSFVVLPVVGMCLAVSLAGSVSPLVETKSLVEGVKKCANWVLGFLLTLFLGILGAQTTVNAAADSALMRTAKFITGSFVPVVGSALGEALTTVRGCLDVLKSSVGVWGVVAVAAILLPVLLELLLWRVGLTVVSSVSDMLGVNRIGTLLRAADTVLAFLIGILLCTALLFIISLTVVMLTGGGG